MVEGEYRPELQAEGEYRIELHSKLEPLVVDKICKPILSHVPESVSPNTLSGASITFAALCFIFAALAPGLEPTMALWARIGAAICIWAFMVGDCLDGMQARRTGQCSRFGEFLDHWFDAVGAPLAASGLTLTLELDPFTTAVVVILTVMVYSAQLVVQHHTGRFIHPPTSGLDAQFLLGLVMVLFGVLLFLFPREGSFMTVLVNIFAAIAAYGAIGNLWFLYKRMDRQALLDHLKLVGISVALSVPYWLSMMSTTAYCMLISFVSFRICGSYVLMTTTKRPYDGLDWPLLLWVPVILVANLAVGDIGLFGDWTVQATLPYVACVQVLVFNLVDLSRSLDALHERGAHKPALS